MTMINLTKIQKNVAGRALFTIDHLVASAGDKIGVVGRNGMGKSTLAHLITGVDTDYRGQLVTDAPVSYVPQLAPTLDQSGGQAMMSRIRQALSARPAILILDEPSSNLDEAHQQWLIAQLQGFQGLLMLISHDRHLLNAVTNQTWAFEGQRVQAYAGNYAHYREVRDQQRQTQEVAYQRQMRHQRDLLAAQQQRNEKAQRIRKGNRRMSAAERSKTKSLREATAAKMERTAKRMVARGAHEPQVAKPLTQRGFKLVATDFPSFTGKTVVTGLNVTLKQYGKTLLTHADFQVLPHERVAIVGPNGSGKTTLLQAILSRRVSGLTLAPAAKVGVFNQDMTMLDGERSVWETVRRASQLPDQTIRNVMGALGLPARFYQQQVAALSGGELVKLQLVAILVGQYNVLMLDEPTNYLDVDALEALAAYLQDYPGTVLFVSHDQSFRDAVATRTLQLTDQQLLDFAQVAVAPKPAEADIAVLQFKYDQLMVDPAATTAEIQALKHQIDQLKA
ncbi:ABC-F family ATP-binding cassette domain-containing protein [Lactiplantibacillus pentosus]|uniref:ABC-F family ATP-binding cassette domain-containing protein n=1 Tax=Lactiplantibacillus pentosus TaxID=1589 RepID=UPI00259B182C|nr:ABC-F family ATP-binding cassette domain-containing protein [Lactiplantibacillus pentosus]WFC03432.1 ABC-F family ATP-binding cassette domain-containing protein [Lactiplantibacillus pentosus]